MKDRMHQTARRCFTMLAVALDVTLVAWGTQITTSALAMRWPTTASTGWWQTLSAKSLPGCERPSRDRDSCAIDSETARSGVLRPSGLNHHKKAPVAGFAAVR